MCFDFLGKTFLPGRKPEKLAASLAHNSKTECDYLMSHECLAGTVF
jgi:hypothetical protein